MTDSIQEVDLLVSSAKVTANRNGNGNTKDKDDKYTQIVKYIKEHSSEEEDEKYAGSGVSARSLVHPFAYKFCLSLSDKPLFWDKIKDLDPDVRVTKGFFSIKHIPKGNREYKVGRPFKIGQDLIHMNVRVAGYRHWLYLCKKIPELAWINRNSTISEELFRIASCTSNMTFWFGVDWVKYEHKLREQMTPEQNKVIINPLLSYKCSFKDYEEKYKDKSAILREFADVVKEINEADKDPEVIAEMEAATGERFIRCRTERDPVTGRFIYNKKEDD